MNNIINILNTLNKVKPKAMTPHERDHVWQCIRASIVDKPVVHRSSLSLFVFMHKTFAYTAVAVIVLLTVSVVTVKAADSAKPGDVLFPLDRIIEHIQLTLAPRDQRGELKIQFARERILEIGDLIDKTHERNNSPSEKNSHTQMDIDTDTLEEVEVKIGPTHTFIEVEFYESRHGFTIENVSEQEIVTRTAERFSVPPEEVRSMITFERIEQDILLEFDETLTIPHEDIEKVERAFARASEFVADVQQELYATGFSESATSLDNLLGQLRINVDSLSEEMQVDIQFERYEDHVELEFGPYGDGEGRVEIKFGVGSRSDAAIDIEEVTSEGTIHIKVKDNNMIKVEQE